MERTYGVELELKLQDNKNGTIQYVYNELKKHKIKVVKSSKNYKSWCVKLDGSLTYGFELVSPIYKEYNGIRKIKRVLKILNDNGAYADKECGLHVHVGVGDLSIPQILSIAKRYSLLENQIDKFVIAGRRGDKNRYCLSNISAYDDNKLEFKKDPWNFYSTNPRIRNYKNINTFADLSNSEIAVTRYLKVNVASYFRHKTVEFRQHQGTADIDQVINWVRFCVNFVNYTVDNEWPEKDNALNGLSRVAKIHFMDRLPKKAK